MYLMSVGLCIHCVHFTDRIVKKKNIVASFEDLSSETVNQIKEELM